MAIRIPATGVRPLGSATTEQLSEVPAIPGLELRDDGSLVLNDGKNEWGLWRVADGIELARGGRAYIFTRVGGRDRDRDHYTYAEHGDGGSSFTRSLEGRNTLHCTFAPAEINRFGDEIWHINGRPSRKGGPAISRPDGAYEWRVNGRLHREGGEPAFFDGRVTSWHEKGKRHRVGGPAVESADGSEWWFEGEIHRTDGPAIERADGSYEWYLNGLRHREGGPALSRPDGTVEWYADNRLHRDDGPAAVKPDGAEFWYQHGKIHNERGPAVVLADGTTKYYLDGSEVPYLVWLRRTGQGATRFSTASGRPASIASAMNRR